MLDSIIQGYELNLHSPNVPSMIANKNLLNYDYKKPEGKRHWVMIYQISDAVGLK